jgi:hypothetical protein
MFDSYQIGPRSIDAHVNVTEKRAPTDESVRLLKEMQREAEKRVLEVVRVDNNDFNCVLHKLDDHLNSMTRLVAIFSLNGKKLQAEHCFDTLHFDREEVVIGIRDAVAKEIANHIASAFSKIRI